MNIRCPNCQTVFRVDPARIPPAGIRARCSKCSTTFPVRPAAAAPRPEPAPARDTAGAAAAPRATQTAPVSTPAPAPPHRAWPQSAPDTAPASRDVRPDPRPPQAEPARPAAEPPPPTPAPAAPPPAAAAPPDEAPASRPGLFTARDPGARAERIARALVSDIVAYHPRRQAECLAAGTLRAEFRDEIMKSWEEYVAQVGLETAKSTPYFRNALNDILAKGAQVF
jgi:predicted Zn finger-like uncharacterized protein